MSIAKSRLTDAETELALLAAVVRNPEAWDSVCDLWRPTLFADPSRSAVAEVVAGLVAARKPFDHVTVNVTLRARGAAETATEAVTLASRMLVRAENARSYAETLADLEAKRRLRTVAEGILADGDGTAEERIERAQRAVLGVSIEGRDETRHIGTDMAPFLESLTAEQGEDWCLSTGFDALDRVLGGFRPGVPVLFAGRPSKGKSALATSIAENLARAGVPVGVFWLEDSRKDFIRRIVQRISRIPGPVLRSRKLSDEQHQILAAADLVIQRLPIWVNDEHGLTATQVAQRMRRMHREHGVRVFIADHVGEIRVEREDRWGDRHDLAVGRAARQFRDCAKDLAAAPVLFAQMNRQVEKRAGNDPHLSDLNNSGELEQIARFVGFVEHGQTSFTIHVRKNTLGPTDVDVPLKWDGGCMTVDGGITW